MEEDSPQNRTESPSLLHENWTKGWIAKVLFTALAQISWLCSDTRAYVLGQRKGMLWTSVLSPIWSIVDALEQTKGNVTFPMFSCSLQQSKFRIFWDGLFFPQFCLMHGLVR